MIENATNLLAACDPIIGCITPPISSGINPTTGQFTGINVFANSLLRLVFIVAGLYAFLNLILAGFGFMSAGGDAKAVTKAWEKIYQTLIGIVIIVCSFLLAAIIGILLFGNPTAVLNPTL